MLSCHYYVVDKYSFSSFCFSFFLFTALRFLPFFLHSSFLSPSLFTSSIFCLRHYCSVDECILVLLFCACLCCLYPSVSGWTQYSRCCLIDVLYFRIFLKLVSLSFLFNFQYLVCLFVYNSHMFTGTVVNQRTFV